MQKFSLLLCIVMLAKTARADPSDPAGQPRHKKTTTGAIYTEINSRPLGHAWQDPRGTLWGDMIYDGDHPLLLTEDNARAYCVSRGARLPTTDEFSALARDMGFNTPQGYSPQILPDLENYFWAEYTANPFDPKAGYIWIFRGSDATLWYDYPHDPQKQNLLRCVSK